MASQDSAAPVAAQPQKQSMWSRMLHTSKQKPIMGFVFAVVAVALLTGVTALAVTLLNNDSATFNSRLTVENPVKQHLLQVDGSGELIATLRDRTDEAADRVRFDLALLDESGNLLQRVVSASEGGRIKMKQTVTPGVYTFIVSSEDELTENGAAYRLRIQYPNDTADFSDTISPTLEITEPTLGETVTGVFTISGVASDETELAQVSVRLDDDAWVVADGLESWSLDVDSAEFSNGQKILSVRAIDESGNEVTEQTLLNFENQQDTDNPTPDPDPDPDPTPDPDPDPTPDPDPNPQPNPTPPPVTGGDFFEDFTGNTGLDNFQVGVYHRNIGQQVLGQGAEVWGDGNAGHGGSWTGDHDLNCGTPVSQRSLGTSKNGGPEVGDSWTPNPDFRLDELVYMCRDHVMTSMGDADGYSILWFSPNQTFMGSDTNTVSWDVNVTDLGARQWWEVSIVPTDSPFLATVDWLAGTANIDEYDDGAVVIGSGPFGSTVNITTNGENQYDNWQGICGTYGLDPEGCNSKPIRRSFSVTDNNNGTLDVDYGGFHQQTVPGSLPDEFQVFFKDHNYTPDKDGVPIGHSWHWDNVRVQ